MEIFLPYQPRYYHTPCHVLLILTMNKINKFQLLKLEYYVNRGIINCH